MVIYPETWLLIRGKNYLITCPLRNWHTDYYYMLVVRLSPKISETVKGKLSLGARILQMGGMEKVFKTLFHVSDKERLLKASQCYLSTTAGPIAGLLFISTRNIAFCSERSLKASCPNGETVRVHYKVMKRMPPSPLHSDSMKNCV